ncbi:MAG: hypothetical protein Q8T03_12105 [Bacteroidota bacterium]|nr:hypothetical protein [Bacteroidota bacterium]
MAVTIEDNGTRIKITDESDVRNVIKSQIRGIEVIKTNIIMIDIGDGVLENIFIQYADVISPAKPDPASLRDAILAFLDTGGIEAKEAKQVQEISLLSDLKASILNLQTLITSIDGKSFYKPLITDKSGANVVYNGYAQPGTLKTAPLWSIEKITSSKGIELHTWADGDMNFDNIWNNRETLVYN